MRYKFIFLSVLLIGAVLLCACAAPKKVIPPQRIGAWLVYWDGERGLAELETNGSLFDRISLYAYELDIKGHPQPAPNFKELLPRLFEFSKNYRFEPWVTVANDVRLEDKKVIPKDVGVLQRILSDPELRRAHAKNLAERVFSDGFAGLDLDYEGLTESDQDNFLDFVSQLSMELHHYNLGLNVILEPKQKSLHPPGTINVTVMGYYLHGEHTGPGPLATPDFIATLNTLVMVDTEGFFDVALAVGGFSWSREGKVRQVEWGDTQNLAASSVKVSRCVLSKVPYARLKDGTEIWFEDPESLQTKWEAAQKANFSGMMLWRLGGNDESLFRLLYDYRSKAAMGKN